MPHMARLTDKESSEDVGEPLAKRMREGENPTDDAEVMKSQQDFLPDLSQMITSGYMIRFVTYNMRCLRTILQMIMHRN